MLPAGTLCGYLAYFVGGFINNLSITLYLGAPPEGWLKVSADVMAHMYLGAVFTYSAVRVAPSAPKYVALAALVLLLVSAGLSLWSSFAIGKFLMRYRLLVVFCLVALPHYLRRLPVRSCRTMPADCGNAGMPNPAFGHDAQSATVNAAVVRRSCASGSDRSKAQLTETLGELRGVR